MKVDQTRPVYDEACRLWGKTPLDHEYTDDGWDELLSRFADPEAAGGDAVRSLRAMGYPSMPTALVVTATAELARIARMFVQRAAGDVFERLAVANRHEVEVEQGNR